MHGGTNTWERRPEEAKRICLAALERGRGTLALQRAAWAASLSVWLTAQGGT